MRKVIYFLVAGLSLAKANDSATFDLTDPVYPKEPKKQHIVDVHYDSQGFPEGYSMNLINKVCLDDVCKLVEVTLFWDAIGYYQRLEYPKGKPLTKVEHDPFTPEEYVKLDTILKDRESILDDHSLGFLATEPDEEEEAASDDVDGVSKATPGAVKEAVVKDAAWTTWVLWKYANTEIVSKLQGITESQCSPEYLNFLLDSKEWSQIEFVLQYCLKQKKVPTEYIDKVATLIPVAGIDGIDLAIDYIEQASSDKEQSYRVLIKALNDLDEYSASVVIELLASDDNLSGDILVALTAALGKQDYYPIHLALQLVEGRKFYSDKVEANVMKLLENEDFFIARRAYEFLSNQEVSSSAKNELEMFQKKHASRL
ncbi:MAG: hypothetical protein AAF226_08590 [Verrucomicrobiota bacterium]